MITRGKIKLTLGYIGLDWVDKGLQRVSRGDRGLQSVISVLQRGYKGLHWVYKGLQGVTRG